MSADHLSPKLENYSKKYRHIQLSREGGVLECRMHTGGESLKWGALPHLELGHCFADIAGDPENQVVILTGAGEDFCAEVDAASFGPVTPASFAQLYEEGRRLIHNLLEIPVPVIAAVNGPARFHAELALMSNIVVAAEHAVFQDAAHFTIGAVPGDGVHVVWPALLGPTRASYFLLTGQTLSAEEAQQLGLVNEILPRENLMARAHALAAEIASRPALVRRHTRTLLTYELKQKLHELLSHGLALEGLAMLHGFNQG